MKKFFYEIDVEQYIHGNWVHLITLSNFFHTEEEAQNEVYKLTNKLWNGTGGFSFLDKDVKNKRKALFTNSSQGPIVCNTNISEIETDPPKKKPDILNPLRFEKQMDTLHMISQDDPNGAIKSAIDEMAKILELYGFQRGIKKLRDFNTGRRFQCECMKDVVGPTEFVEELNRIEISGKQQAKESYTHIINIMCEILRKLGYEVAIDKFKEMMPD